MEKDELLRQNVFSSIHMSTSIKSNQVSVSYPMCSLCGGAMSGTVNKKPSARKVAVFQITLYTNSSESFVVWGKKTEEPKGILWLRSCCVRRGSDAEGNCDMPIELLSKGCRGRCSYTLRFSSRIVAEDWYRLLKQESRKSTPMEDDDPFSSDSGEEDASPLDRILSDTRIGDCSLDGEQVLYQQSPSNRRISAPTMKSTKYNSSVSADNNLLSGSLPQRKLSGKMGGFRLPFSQLTDRKISLPTASQCHPNNGHAGILESPAELERWSWPVKVSY